MNGGEKSVRLEAGLDLESTLDSGQVFHWTREEEGQWFGCIGDQLVGVFQEDRCLRVTPGETETCVRDYFALDEDWEAILATFPADDDILSAAVEFCPGLRLIRQPLWECLATFLTSSLKQVSHIRQISLQLRERFGQEQSLGKLRAYSYPNPQQLAACGEEALRSCGLGYRAKSMGLAAERVASGQVDLEEGRSLDDRELLEFLLQFHGVGEKIAHCVMLFGYGRLASFPVDVWIERILRERYFAGKRPKEVSKQKLAQFASNHFGEYGGYAQQFLFHYARKSLRRSL